MRISSVHHGRHAAAIGVVVLGLALNWTYVTWFFDLKTPFFPNQLLFGWPFVLVFAAPFVAVAAAIADGWSSPSVLAALTVAVAGAVAVPWWVETRAEQDPWSRASPSHVFAHPALSLAAVGGVFGLSYAARLVARQRTRSHA